jgi:hypothetical protein
LQRADVIEIHADQQQEAIQMIGNGDVRPEIAVRLMKKG